jgi:hypothetical protein
LTFKDLNIKVSLEITSQQTKLFEELLNKPFWILDIQQYKQEDIKTMETAALITLLDFIKKMQLIDLYIAIRKLYLTL